LKQDVVFYVNEDRCPQNKWNYLEYGFDVLPEVTSSDSLKVFFWNVSGYNNAYIDNVKTQICITDASMEMIP
jgi:hypothetical protein